MSCCYGGWFKSKPDGSNGIEEGPSLFTAPTDKLLIVKVIETVLGKVPEKRTKYVKLLQKLHELRFYIENLSILTSENNEKDKLMKAFEFTVEGLKFCEAQLNSGKLVRYLKSGVNFNKISTIDSQISDLYQDLNSIVNIEKLQAQPVSLPLLPVEYSRAIDNSNLPYSEIEALTDNSNLPYSEIESLTERPSLLTTSIRSYFEKPPVTWKEVGGSLKEVDIAFLDNFVSLLADVLVHQKNIRSVTSTSSRSSNIKEFLSRLSSILPSEERFLNAYTKHMDTKEGFFKSKKTIEEITLNILRNIGQTYSTSTITKMRKNHTDCIKMLHKMVELALYIKKLWILVPGNEKNKKDEKFVNVFHHFIEMSIFCINLLYSTKLHSFLTSSENSSELSAIRSTISDLYRDVNSIVDIEMLLVRTVSLPLLPLLPLSEVAVGIEDQLQEVNKLVNISEKPGDNSSFVIIIWGAAGIRKTTLAQVVVSKIDKNHYNCAKIILDEVSQNNYIEKQQYILKYAFPNYMGGRKIDLRDNEEGKVRLREACESERDKPVFLYIDNVLHKKDLKALLPEDFRSCLPSRSRLLVTTRNMDIADVFEERGFVNCIKDYQMKTLSDNDALQILCKESAIGDRIKVDLKKIVNVCKGIPLVLKMVGADLQKEKYNALHCTHIVQDLNECKEVGQLSDRIFHFLYDKLDEATKKTFLDICCYFNKSKSRQFVEDVVGTREVGILQEAGLIIPVMVQVNIIDADMEERFSVHDTIASIGRRLAKSTQ